MSDGNFFLGLPREFKKICLIYPPKVKEVVSNNIVQVYIKLLTITQEDIEDEVIKGDYSSEEILKKLLNPFEYLLNNVYNNKEIAIIAKEAFNFFIHEDVTFLPENKIVVIGDVKSAKSLKDLRYLKEEDYFEFQNLIRESIGKQTVRPPEEMPLKLRAMKAKSRYRDKVKQKKSDSIETKNLLASICCMGLGLNPLNVGEISYAAFNTVISIYQGKEKYEFDMRSILAGADSEKVKPEYWIKNIKEV